jgi:uncharacterized protein DUF6541
VLVLLVALGLVRLARHRRTRWVPLAWVVFLCLWILPTLVPDDVVRRLTWPWWNDGVRLLALVSIPATICVAAGAISIVRAVPRGRGLPRRRLLAAEVVVLGAVAVSAVAAHPARVAAIEAAYDPPLTNSEWVTEVELAALRELAGHVRDDAAVAANPWRGGSYMYVLAGTRMLFPTEKTLDAPGGRVLASRLDRVRDDRVACAWTREHGVAYVLTGGDAHRDMPADIRDAYRGIDGVAADLGFERVASADPFTLYSVPDCPAEGSS